MPKMKTKSGAKKRFKLTASGKVRAKHSGKRHNLRRKSQKQVSNLRGPKVLCDADARIVKQYMPNG